MQTQHEKITQFNQSEIIPAMKYLHANFDQKNPAESVFVTQAFETLKRLYNLGAAFNRDQLFSMDMLNLSKEVDKVLPTPEPPKVFKKKLPESIVKSLELSGDIGGMVEQLFDDIMLGMTIDALAHNHGMSDINKAASLVGIPIKDRSTKGILSDLIGYTKKANETHNANEDVSDLVTDIVNKRGRPVKDK